MNDEASANTEDQVTGEQPEPTGPQDQPRFWDTLLCDIEWSGGPVDVDDDKDPEGWKAKGLDTKRFVNCLQNLGFYATVMYRVSRWFYLRGHKVPAYFLQMFNHSFTGAELSHKADVGPGLRIGHPQGVFIGPDCKVGFRSTFNQGTALSSNMEMEEGTPQAGNYLYMSPGAKIFGHVKIGNRVWVGPNSVAMKNIEDDKVVLGVPGRAMPPTFRVK